MTDDVYKKPLEVGNELRELYIYQKQRMKTGLAKEQETTIISSETTKNIEVCANLLDQINEVQANMGTVAAIENKDQKVKSIIEKY